MRAHTYILRDGTMQTDIGFNKHLVHSALIRLGHHDLGSRIYPLFQKSAALEGRLDRAERGKPKKRADMES